MPDLRYLGIDELQARPPCLASDRPIVSASSCFCFIWVVHSFTYTYTADADWLLYLGSTFSASSSGLPLLGPLMHLDWHATTLQVVAFLRCCRSQPPGTCQERVRTFVCPVAVFVLDCPSRNPSCTFARTDCTSSDISFTFFSSISFENLEGWDKNICSNTWQCILSLTTSLPSLLLSFYLSGSL